MFQEKTQNLNRTTLINQQIKMFGNINTDQQTLSMIKDSLISIQYRIRTVQQQINSKMERQQCLTLLERKANINHVKKSFEEINLMMQTDRAKDIKNFQTLQQEQKTKINDLKKKLKEINHRSSTQTGSIGVSSGNFSIQKISNKLDKVLIKPQELFLESNQTMFSMLVDEIKQLKNQDSVIQRLIESKHKKTVSLNNQVCRKLEFLENQIEQTIKYIDNTWTANQQQLNSSANEKKAKKSQTTKVITKQKQKSISQSPNQAFELIRLQLLSKSIQNLQRQVAQKINIKDILPLIRQNLSTFQDSIVQIREYVQQNFQSTKNILTNQSLINQEISLANRFAWFHCYDKEDDYQVFSKEIINIIPEVINVSENQPTVLTVSQQGWYLIKVYGVEQLQQQQTSRDNTINQINVEVEVNNVRYLVDKEKIMNFAANTSIQFLTDQDDLFLQILKL